MKSFLQKLNKVYYFNFLLISSLLITILTTFLVQFKVEDLQKNIAKTESEIEFYQDKIKALEIEWVYLTSPERLRELSAKYLNSNNYIKTTQVKNFDKLKNYYLANYDKYLAQEQELAMN